MIKKKIFIIIILSVILIGCTPTTIDPHAKHYDFKMVVEASGINKELLIQGLEKNILETKDLYLKGENSLILGRITGDNRFISFASDFFSKALEKSEGEELALFYEGQASLLNSKYYHARAAWQWKKLGNEFRFRINKNLALGLKPNLTFKIPKKEEYTIDTGTNPKTIQLGQSSIKLTAKDILVSQTDRVTRDWLSYQIQNPNSEQLLSLFSEQLNYPKEELMPEIGWHEGARIKEIKNRINLTHKVATGTIVAKKEGKWYAPNENGIFMFEVPIDKINYPSTRPLGKDIAIIMDTHGVNMIVAQAIENNATVVMGCCDHPGKIEAAKYLSQKGIKVICNTDRFLPNILGSKENILGSAPFEQEKKTIIIGKRPIEIAIDEPIIITDIDAETYALWYYDTPKRYFTLLEERSGLDLNLKIINLTDFNQMEYVIKKAEEEKAKIIGVRIFNKDDYEKVKEWLEKDINNKAILFHSEAYPYGYKLAREFVAQTSFDDINPVIV